MLSWLSTFLMNPALAVGASAVAGPILIHIFSKRRYRRVKWAAMKFLLDAQRKNRRRVKLEQMILLALRCLAVLLLAMMVARPFLGAGTAAALVGARARTERIILLDDSFSMGYRLPTGQSVFAQASQAAKQLAKWIAADSSADSLTLLTTSHPRQPVTILANLSEENVRRLDDFLAALNPSQMPARFPDAMSAVAELVRRSPTQANTAIYVLSDFQRRDWRKPSASETAGPAIAPLVDIAKGRTSLKLALIDVGADSPRNVAVIELVPAQPLIAAGVPARFEVAVANYTPIPLDRVELSLSLSQQTLPPMIIPRIQPGQVVREPIEAAFPQEGADYLKVQLAGSAAADSLALDNSRAAPVRVVAASEVLLVNGEPGGDSLRDEVFLLKTALRPAGRSASGNEVTVVTEQELDAVDWAKYHVVALANVPRLGASARNAIEQFVAAGGGLVVFAGDLVDADFYNRELYNDGRGWLPARLGESVHAPAGAEPFTFADWDANHPVMRAFTGPLASVLRQVRIREFLAAAPLAPTTRPAIPSAASQPVEPLVLVRYNDDRRSPAVILRPFGRGLVALITTSADQEWNEWGASFSYVPLMLELFQFMAKPAQEAVQTTVGAPIVMPLDLAVFQPRARLRSPAYPVDPEIPLEAKPTDRGQSQLRYEDAAKTGVWTFELTGVNGQSVERFATVNPDPAESDLTRATRAEIDASMGEIKFDYVRDVSAFTRDTAAARTEIWWPLLIAAAIVLMTEHGLAWYFGTRG